MRLIGKLPNEQDAFRFSTFLQAHHIPNYVDIHTETDWGKEDYGTHQATIWVIDEDQVDEANRYYEQFKQDPKAAQYADYTPIQQNVDPLREEVEAQQPTTERRMETVGRITLYLIILCSMIYGYSELTKPRLESVPAFVPYTAVFSSKIYKDLYFDYPKAYDIIDQYVRLYGLNSLQNPADIPQQGQLLLSYYVNTPYWKGLYTAVVTYLIEFNHGKEEAFNLKSFFNVPMFEKIQEGEVWRFFTPILLHSDIFHLLFNLMWLFVLGRQMESRLSTMKYIAFILAVALISNTSQYLMSGSNFIGISGVLCGMFTFIWYRLRQAPWEGYQLHPTTIGLMTIFVLGIAAIQLASFFTEITYQVSFSPGMANTAHLAGALAGFLIARIPSYAAYKL